MISAFNTAGSGSLPRTPRTVLVTGGTGYIGRALIPALAARGHRVTALVRRGSERKVDAAARTIVGSPLVARDIVRALEGVGSIVHLVGVAKPSPSKAREFRRVDLASIQAAVAAAVQSHPAPHFIYLSVAHPAPVMREYIEVRQEGEALIQASGLDATIVRPWYVLGPGHRWPYLLLPLYGVLRLIPSMRPTAERLGFVTLAEMIAALIDAVEQPSSGVRTANVPEIRDAAQRMKLSLRAAEPAFTGDGLAAPGGP